MPRSLPTSGRLSFIFGSIEKYTRTLLRSSSLGSILDHPRSNPYTHEFSFPLVKKVEGLEGQEELCFINNNGSWYKKEPNFQYNNYQQKSYSNNQQSGYPPRNNQQGSYQPQQNPSSGSSAPQESSTDTLLKQILESQTRSEKQVGYELKNLHSKIDGSYNELNNKFSHLASTAFGAQKGVFRVVIGRARHGATSPERHHQVALTSLLERPYQSDREKSLTVSSLGDARTSPERPPGATPRSRSHLTPLSERPPKATPRGRSRLYGETTRSEAWSDLSERPTEVAPEGRSDLSERHAEVAPRLLSARFLFYLRAFWSFHYALSTCILGALISLRTGSTIFYTTTFVLGALKTPNINSKPETIWRSVLVIFFYCALALSSMTPSRVFLDTDVQETEEYLTWMNANLAVANRVNADVVTKTETVTIGDLFSYMKQEDAKFECIATIADVVHGSSWYYIGCGGCHTKATKGPTTLMCRKCGKTEIVLAKISVHDSDDQASFVLLGDVGHELSGRKASELVASYFEADENVADDHLVPVPQALIDTIGQTRKFIVKVSNHNLTGKTQALTVTKVLPLEVQEVEGALEGTLQKGVADGNPSTCVGIVKRAANNVEAEDPKRARCG
ncbi:hypothetical protein IGI04_016630 [Brassica rapa subsp. trilocularis]|uniref:Replication factor A C-terminal domain-containing protein n=1 Tax=Brassica rapa subsp. trilocularis TaxID=1813537 RepID=A0ABQ7MTI7_BRACM|nr:hypothetical protein IGI04_016630 [Brassica rapa subsp. trilocularis]